MANETRNTHLEPVGQGASTVDEEIFIKYKPATFTVGGRTFAFPVQSIDETGANRIIERERPYRDGAKLDDTGAKAIRWSFDVLFENSISDEGLKEVNGELRLYPDVLNALLEIFAIHATGDLHIPTRGVRRVRAETFSRRESYEARDAASLKLTFIEDNEDSVDASSIASPSPHANARRLAETTTFDSQSAGAWDSSLNDLDQFVADLEGLMNAPGDFAQSIKFMAAKIRGNSQRARQAFMRSGRRGRDLLLDPTNSRAERKLVQQQEMAAKAENSARKGRPKTLQVVFRERTSIVRASVILQQSLEELMEINPTLDPLNVPAMTPINVFVTEELFYGQPSPT